MSRRRKNKKRSLEKKLTRSKTIEILRRFPDLNCLHMGSSRSNRVCGTLGEEDIE